MALNADAEALERGILEHPHEFVRWAVYADYLTEQGDPRGEFMRVQLDLEDETLSAEDRKTLKRREGEILAEHERTWLGPLADFTVDDGGRFPGQHRFERGWLATLELRYLDAQSLAAFVGCEDARLIHSLAFDHDIDDFDQNILLDCPHLRAVRSLRIGELVEINDESTQAFNSSAGGQFAHELVERLPSLEVLDLYASNIELPALFQLASPRLRSLTLFHTSGTLPLETLAANQSMANLATLRCHPHSYHRWRENLGAYIGLDQLRAICRSPHLTSLSHLCLRLTDFGDDGARELVSSGILKRLRILDLFGGCMSDEGAKLLATCPDFENLEFANLRKNAFTAEGIAVLEATSVKLDLRQQHTSTEVVVADNRVPDYLYEGDFE